MASVPDKANAGISDYERDLEEQYAAAMDEWLASPDAELWDSAVGDGLDEEDFESTPEEPQ